MKTFYERFKDHIDATDGTVVITEDIYKSICEEANKESTALKVWVEGSVVRLQYEIDMLRKLLGVIGG